MARTYNKGTLIIERTTFGQPENNAGYFLEYDNDLGVEYQVASNIAPDGYYKGVMMPTHDGGSGTHYHISFKNLTLGQLMKAIEADPNIPGAKAYLYSEGTNTHASNRANIKARLDVNEILSEVLPDKVTGAAGVADSGLGGLDFVLNFTEADAIDYVGFGESPLGDVVASTGWQTLSVPATVPDAPTNLSAASVDTGIYITFTAPINDGGSEITRYEATVNGGSTYFTVTNEGIIGETEGLVYGTSYDIQVRAVNDIGESVWSSTAVSAVAGTAPAVAPTINVTAVASDSITFDWTPASGGSVGSLQHSYTIDNGVSFTLINESPVTITGLTPETPYTIRVQGSNSVGPSPVAEVTETTLQAATAAPSMVRVIGVTSLNDTGTTDYNINVYYQQPFDNGSAITQFEVKVYAFDEAYAGTEPPITGEALVTQYFVGDAAANPSFVVSMLGYEGTTVVPIVRAENGDGWSEPSVGYFYGSDGVFNEGDLPAKVRVGSLTLTPQITSVSSVSGTGSVTLNWNDGEEGLGPDSSYIETTVHKRAYQIYDGGGVAIGTPVEFTPALPGNYPTDNPTLSTEITGLASGNYQFKVLLANVVDYGDGSSVNWIASDFSDVVAVTAADAVPAAPTFSLSYLQGQDSLQLLTADDGANGDIFGLVAAIDGDTAIIGAYNDDDTATDAGAAYVFTKVNGTWTQTQKLLASDGAASDGFGWSVAISGDTAIVSSWSEDDLGSNAGSAYIFTKDAVNGTWSETQKLLASDGSSGDIFGMSVSISGDIAIVGASYDDDTASDVGAAYIFTKDVNGTWSETAKLLASDGAASDNFGDSVAIDGDTAVVGISSNEGAAYIFTKDVNGTWTQTQKLTTTDGSSGDLFGQEVSISGDTVVVGARRDDDLASNAGATYIFTKDVNGTWTQTQKITESDVGYSLAFGHSVAIDGDTIVVGTSNYYPAYVYSKDLSGTWVRTHRLLSHNFDNPSLRSNFGFVAVSGNSVFVGSHEDNTDTGAVCAFDLTNLQVSFADPSDTSITDYEYAVSLDGGVWSDFVSLGGTTSPFTIEGIAYTQDVDVKLLARNSNGPSEESLDSITAITVPSNDLSFSASPVATGIQISITNPATGAAGYEVTVDGGSRYNSLPADGILTTDYGITLGSTYDVQVRAISLAGESDWSAATNVFAGEPTVPAAPTDVTATSVSEGIQVTFTAPTNDGGSTITRYEATVDDGSSSFPVTNGGTIGETEGLTYGGTYYIQVRAVNNVGAGAWSSSAVSAIAGTAPTAPSITSASKTRDSITFNWTAGTGEGTITHEYSVDNGANWIDAGTSPTTITGLNASTTYTIRLKATNAVGSTETSSVDVTTLAPTVPDAPTDVTATSVETGIQVTFTAPTDDGSSTITGYEATVNGGSTYFPVTSGGVIGDAEGLTYGTSYPVQVRAVNAIGAGTWSGAVYGVAGIAPTVAPTIDSASSESFDSITFNWTAGAGEGTITHEYSVNGGPWTDAGTSSPTTITGLNASTTYTIRLQTSNEVGSIEASSSVEVTTQSGVPSAPTFSSLSYSIQGQDSLLHLTASDAELGDFFGGSVAIDGDTAIVGANRDDDTATDAGAAYIFTKDVNGTWTQTQKLTASDGAASDLFGESVAIDGDTAIVGAGSDDDLGTKSGAAYIFTKDVNGTWNQTVKLLPSDGDTRYQPEFGSHVSISGNTAVVSLQSSVVYFFTKDVYGVWGGADSSIQGARTENTQVTVSSTPLFESLAADGDTAIAGASTGAFIFTNVNGTWTETQTLTTTNGSSGDYFGGSVSISGDTVVVGAYNDDATALNAGAAYIFTNVNGTWSEAQKLTSPDVREYARFGRSVAIDGDTLVVSSIYSRETNKTGVYQAGAAYVYSKDLSGTWVRNHRLVSHDFDNPLLSDSFGYAVAVSGNSVLAGSPYDESSTGSVCAFEVASNLEVDAVSSNQGSHSITDYEYAIKLNTDTVWSDFVSLGGVTSPFTIDGVAHSQTVDVKLRAVNQVGESAESSDSVTAITAPSNDTTFTAVAHADGISITIDAGPANNGGSPITGYEFTVLGGSEYYGIPEDTDTNGAGLGTWSVVATADHGITLGSTYDVQVRAISLAGESAPTASVSVTAG